MEEQRQARANLVPGGFLGYTTYSGIDMCGDGVRSSVDALFEGESEKPLVQFVQASDIGDIQQSVLLQRQAIEGEGWSKFCSALTDMTN